MNFLSKLFIAKNRQKNMKKNSIKIFPVFVDQINKSLVDTSYQQANIGFVIGIICAIIIWFRLHSYVISINVFAWTFSIIIITLLRALVVNVYNLQDHSKKSLNKWRYFFILSCILGGSCWGLLSYKILPYVVNDDQILILMILAGITAGAVSFMSGILIAVCLFLFTALLPVSVYYLLHHRDILIGMAILIYLISLSIQAKRINKMLKNGLLLQYELLDAKNHDPLTNVANRRLFTEYLSISIEKAKISKTKVALIYMDLNKFKVINDSYGHQFGDEILKIFVARLKSIFKDRDSIARLGGDEFTVTINKMNEIKDINKLWEKISNALENPALINGQNIKIETSFGISVFPDDGGDIESLLKIADTRMYSNKLNK